MTSSLHRLAAGSPYYRVEPTGEGGFVIIRDDRYAEDFSRIVRNLMNCPSTDFIVLPTHDGRRGYARAVILPL